MFENAKPPVIPSAHQNAARDVRNADQFTHLPSPQSDGTDTAPLRAIEWSELTARLSAARDLRQLLRTDVAVNSGPESLGFADAAAQFFRAGEEDERCVNPNALGPRKTSSVTNDNVECTKPSTGNCVADEGADRGPDNSRHTRNNPTETREEQ